MSYPDFVEPEISKPAKETKFSFTITNRYLTEPEIEEIIRILSDDSIIGGETNYIKNPYNYYIPGVHEINKYKVLRVIRNQLYRFKCYREEDNEVIKQQLLSLFNTLYKRCLLNHSVNVGVKAAHSVGSSATQTTLNTFHFSGAKHIISDVVSQMSKMLYGNKLRRESTSMTIHFSNPDGSMILLDEEDMFSFRGVIKMRTLGDYVSDYSISVILRTAEEIHKMHPDDWSNHFAEYFNTQPVSQPGILVSKFDQNPNIVSDMISEGIITQPIYFLETRDNILYLPSVKEDSIIMLQTYLDNNIQATMLYYEPDQSTYEMSNKIFQRQYWHAKYDMTRIVRVLELNLKPDVLYKSRKTPSHLANIMSERVGDQVEHIIGSPMCSLDDCDSKIQVFVYKDKDYMTYRAILSEIDLEDYLVSGIKDIIDVYPSKVKIMSVINTQVKITDNLYSLGNIRKKYLDDSGPKGNYWYLITNWGNVISRNITIEYVRYYLKEVGITIIEEVGLYEGIVDEITKEEIEKFYTVFKYPAGFIVEVPDNSKPLDYISKRSKEDPRIERLSNYYYATTTGTNLKGMLQFDFIDKAKTITNDLQEIEDIFGAEYTRMLFVTNFEYLLTISELSIASSHIYLLADRMFLDGRMAGATFQDKYMTRDIKPNPMRNYVTENGTGVTIAAAQSGLRSKASTFAVSLAVGQESNSGSGSKRTQKEIDDYFEREMLREYTDILNAGGISMSLEEFKSARYRKGGKTVKRSKKIKFFPVPSRKAVDITEGRGYNGGEREQIEPMSNISILHIEAMHDKGLLETPSEYVRQETFQEDVYEIEPEPKPVEEFDILNNIIDELISGVGTEGKTRDERKIIDFFKRYQGDVIRI